jgi:hypothetical protein
MGEQDARRRRRFTGSRRHHAAPAALIAPTVSAETAGQSNPDKRWGFSPPTTAILA